MNVTAAMDISIPIRILLVNGSPNTSVPTIIAVIGSNTPNTDALVAPILRVDTARVAVDMMVGKIASPIRFSQSILVSIPAVRS